MTICFCVAGGCEREDQIIAYEAPKELPRIAPNLPVAGPAPAQAATNPADAERGATWTLPEGWKEQPARAMRVATIRTSEAPDAAELIITRFGADSYKDKLANINRWRGQVGLAPVADPAEQPVKSTTVGGATGDLYEFAGTANGKALRQFVAAVPRGDLVWFFRFTGTPEEIAAHQEKFDAFLRSVQW
jgi:hypothetical protein